jgi:hypothetical protein
MAGLISVNKEKTWSAANWVFDHILRVSRKHLPREGSARIVELMENIVPGLYSLSLENLSPAEIKIFREALYAAYEEVLSAGRESFGEPEFYPGFMKRFEELIEMIPSDEY